MSRSPCDAWDVLRAGIAGGATCVFAVVVPASAEPPPAMMAALTDRERQHAARLHVAADRHLYIAAHYLLTRGVRAIADSDTLSWSFEPDTTGKPQLVVEGQKLHASLSHTRGAVAVAFSGVADVGVDVEAIAPLDELDQLAERVLSDRERHAVFGSVDPLQTFTRLWTRKEAIAKAFGSGLRLPFNSIDVLDPAALLLPPELPGAVALSDLPISAPCHLSVAVRRTGMQSVSVEIPFDLLAAEAANEGGAKRP